MEILLDTNFILTCVKQKLDFVDVANRVITEEVSWLVPVDVIEELEKIKNKKGKKTVDKEAANLSLQILSLLHPTIVVLKGKNPNVDMKIKNYIKGTPIILATLDKDLKSKTKNKILTIKGKKNLEII